MAISKIVTASITDNAVTAAKVPADTLTAADLAANSVDSSELVDGSVDLSHMSANSVDSDQYVDGSIDLVHMSANSVDSDQYVDASIDLAHMSANSVDSDQYVDGSIDNAHLADDAVGTDELANNVAISTSGSISTSGGLQISQADITPAVASIYHDSSSRLRITGGTAGYLFQDDTNATNQLKIDASGNVGIGVSPNISERLAVKCADSTTANLRVLGAASGAATEGAVCLSPGDLEANASGAFVALYWNSGTARTQLDFTVTVGADNWRGGPCGSYLITMQGGNWQGGGFLSVNKPRSGTYLVDWEQVWSSGSSATISMTTPTLTAYTCTGYLRAGSSDNFYYGYTIHKVGGSGGNGGGPLTFSETTY